MKASTSTILSLFSILVISISWANSTNVMDNFFQCLSKNQHNFPSPLAVYTSNNSTFTSVLYSYARNLRFMTPTTPKPLAIVAVTHELHISATIICAKSVGLQIRIRSGGHDLEGLSYTSEFNVPFIVLDMFNLHNISINMTDETAWVQAGASLGEVYYRIAEKSKVHGFPAGVCPTVGTGGHFGGGGYGNLMRKYGLSIDNIVDAKVVDVNGRFLDREAMGEDLFWAIRGGSAASFCVVVTWKIKLVPVPETVTVFQVDKTVEEGATDIVFKWQHVADKVNEDLFLRLFLAPVNGTQAGTKTIKSTFFGMFLGLTDGLLPLMNESLPELGLQQKDCIEMSWIESILFWQGFPKGTPIEVLLDRIPKGEIYSKGKSDYVKEPIPKTGLEAIWKAMIESEVVGIQLNPYGGKMSEISASATPFPHRAGNVFQIHYLVNWIEDGIQTANRYLNLTRMFFHAMTPYVSKNPREAFLNYRDIDIGINENGTYQEGSVYGIKYFKENFDKLVHVKTRVDPDNFFRYEQSIPTRPSLRKMKRGS